MSGPGYVFKNSGLTPPALDEQHENKFPVSETRDMDSDFNKALGGDLTQTDSATRPANEIAQNGQPGLVSRLPDSISRLDPTPILQEKAAIIQKELAPDSHELAKREHESRGAVQVHRSGEDPNIVRDIGWHKANVEIPDPLIGGLSNGRLFAMIRRFNKDVFAVRRAPSQVIRGLDLNEVWDEEYASDKITLHLQRVYLSFVLGFASLGKQISRLRSWKETRRTSAFAAAYFVAWIFDLLMPLVLGTLILIIASAEIRDTLFPPAPRALVSTATGGIQKPQAGQLGTSDTLTGAPEKQVGEGVEEEAANFVNNLRHLVQKTIGMHEKQKNEGDPLEGKIPKPVRKAVREIKGHDTTSGHAQDDAGQTEKPMEEVLWSKANPEIIAPYIKTAPHAIGELVDNWERFANAISPTPPFSGLSYLRIDGVLLPLFLGSFFISSYMVYKGTGFAIGFGLFGDPILTPALDWLNRNYPNWVELLQPKNNILRGVPTNSQLTITLLRIGEAHNTPLPPVPTSNNEDADNQKSIDIDEIPVGDSTAEKMDAIYPSASNKAHTNESGQENKENEPKHKKLSKITRFFKGNTKAAVETKLAADHVLAGAGSKKAKGHLGVLPKEKNLVYAGPSDFKARYEGKKGWLFITETSPQLLSFTTHDPQPDGSHTKAEPLLTIAAEDIKTLKRATAFVSKAGEMAADWSSERQLLGSVEIEDLNGKEWRFTALPERDELFNRLVALGSQRWDNL